MLSVFQDKSCWQTILMTVICLLLCAVFVFVYPAQDAKAVPAVLGAVTGVALIFVVLMAMGVVDSDEMASRAQNVWNNLSPTVQEYYNQLSRSVIMGTAALGASMAYFFDVNMVEAVADTYIDLYGDIPSVLSSSLSYYDSSKCVIDGKDISFYDSFDYRTYYNIDSFADQNFSMTANNYFDYVPFPSDAPNFAFRFTYKGEYSSYGHYNVSYVNLSSGYSIILASSYDSFCSLGFSFTSGNLYLKLDTYNGSYSNSIYYLGNAANDPITSPITNFAFPLCRDLYDVVAAAYAGTASIGSPSPVYSESISSDFPNWAELALQGKVPVSSDAVNTAVASIDDPNSTLLHDDLTAIAGSLAGLQLTLDEIQGQIYADSFASSAEYAAAAETAIAEQDAVVEAAEAELQQQNQNNDENAKRHWKTGIIAAILAFLALLGTSIYQTGSNLVDYCSSVISAIVGIYNSLPAIVKSLIWFTFVCLVTAAVFRRFLG